MRAGQLRNFIVTTARPTRLAFGWRQAGFSSFAYRLAHLRMSRGLALAGTAMAFYLT
jgi:hypothetical protein